MTHQVTLKPELINYREQNVEANVCSFSLPGLGHHKSKPTRAQGTGEFVTPPDLPHLALLPCLYHGVSVNSCQADRHFSSLYVLIINLPASISSFKLEHMMFLELNQGCLPQVKKCNAVIAAQQTTHILSLRNLVMGYECGRVFPAGVGPNSPSRDAVN